MIIKNLQKNKKGFRSGFVLLFAVTLAALLAGIAVGVSNIAFRELRFSTNARATNDAFFAADTGVECALFNDKFTGSSFPPDGQAGAVDCAQNTPTFSGDVYTFTVVGLGSTDSGCAVVTVKKDITSEPPNVLTTIVSKGYNVGAGNGCVSQNPNRIERELKVTY